MYKVCLEKRENERLYKDRLFVSRHNICPMLSFPEIDEQFFRICKPMASCERNTDVCLWMLPSPCLHTAFHRLYARCYWHIEGHTAKAFPIWLPNSKSLYFWLTRLRCNEAGLPQRVAFENSMVLASLCFDYKISLHALRNPLLWLYCPRWSLNYLFYVNRLQRWLFTLSINAHRPWRTLYGSCIDVFDRLNYMQSAEQFFILNSTGLSTEVLTYCSSCQRGHVNVDPQSWRLSFPFLHERWESFSWRYNI